MGLIRERIPNSNSSAGHDMKRQRMNITPIYDPEFDSLVKELDSWASSGSEFDIESKHWTSEEFDVDVVSELLCPNSAWKIICNEHHLKPFVIQLTQASEPKDHEARQKFCRWANGRRQTDPLFYRKILFSDVAEFRLDGTVCKHNCYYTSDKERAYEEPKRSSPEESLTVWCGMHAGEIVGPFIFRTGDDGPNGFKAKYEEFLKTSFIGRLIGFHGEPRLLIQQDDSPLYTDTNAILEGLVNDRFISPEGPINWPPRSCDLTPMNYFLWGYLQAVVYAEMPTSLAHLKVKIHQATYRFNRDLLEKACKNWGARIEYVLTGSDVYLEDVLKKESRELPDFDADLVPVFMNDFEEHEDSDYEMN